MKLTVIIEDSGSLIHIGAAIENIENVSHPEPLRAAILSALREARDGGIEHAAQVGYRTAPDVESGMRVYAAIRALASSPLPPGHRQGDEP